MARKKFEDGQSDKERRIAAKLFVQEVKEALEECCKKRGLIPRAMGLSLSGDCGDDTDNGFTQAFNEVWPGVNFSATKGCIHGLKTLSKGLNKGLEKTVKELLDT